MPALALGEVDILAIAKVGVCRADCFSVSLTPSGDTVTPVAFLTYDVSSTIADEVCHIN